MRGGMGRGPVDACPPAPCAPPAQPLTLPLPIHPTLAPAVPMVEMPGPSPSSGKPMGTQPEMPAIPPPAMAEAAPAEAASSGGGGWFGGWLSGGKKEEEAPRSSAPKDLSQDPFAPPPMPHFGGGAEPQFR